MIFKNFRFSLSEAQIDLFYNKKIVDDIAFAVKFCPKSNIYYSVLHDSFREVSEDNFIRDFFEVFIGRLMKGDLKYRIPKSFSKLATERGYAGFICYL